MDDIQDNLNLKSYISFWVGQMFSLLGSIIVQFIITWWLTIETQSVIILAISSCLYIIPQVIILPFAGVIADKWNRKKIILIADSTQAGLTLVMIILFEVEAVNDLLGITIILSINTLRGACQAFHYPTINAIIPSMVPKNKLSRVNGLTSTFNQLIQILGPALAIFLLPHFLIKHVLWIDIFTFLIALVPLILIEIPATNKEKEVQKTKFFNEFKQGFQIIKKIPLVLTMIMLFMFLNFLLQPISVLLPYFVSITHRGTVSDYAFIMMLFNIGFFLGGVVMSIKKKWNNKIRTIFLGVASVILGYFLLSMSPFRAYLYMGIVFSLIGFNLPITNSLFQTILQTKVPREKIGRVFSIYVALSWLISPIGKILTGILAEMITITSLFLICSIIGFFVTFTFFYITRMHMIKKEDQLAVVLTQPSLKAST
ncbi:MAG: MFS transporter [Promethearchaeota archaeon]